MVSFGCNLLASRRYADDVRFARASGFDFLQIGYAADGFHMHSQDVPYVETVASTRFPVTIHALLRVSEFAEHLPSLLRAAQTLCCQDLVIHPISQTREPGSTSIGELMEGIGGALQLFRSSGISLCLENNGGVDPLFSSVEDIAAVFATYPDLGFLLDLAHTSYYDTLCRMVDVRMPEILHIADRRTDAIHEHLPVGEGDIDFKRIVSGPLAEFRGKAILEVPATDEHRIAAREHSVKWWPNPET